jgi:hypothetical protein
MSLVSRAGLFRSRRHSYLRPLSGDCCGLLARIRDGRGEPIVDIGLLGPCMLSASPRVGRTGVFIGSRISRSMASFFPRCSGARRRSSSSIPVNLAEMVHFRSLHPVDPKRPGELWFSQSAALGTRVKSRSSLFRPAEESSLSRFPLVRIKLPTHTQLALKFQPTSASRGGGLSHRVRALDSPLNAYPLGGREELD